jgi:Cu(I)/Ag(I) efflux system membrane fusion protein
MKTVLLTLVLFALSAVHGLAAVYQCPMHPWIKSDHEGKCTICGMDLVEAAPAAAAGTPTETNLVTLTPGSATAIGVQTAPVRRAALARTLRVAGVIEDDDTRHRILSARVPGRIEKLNINFVGAEVSEGAPLATVYSPEMLTAQRTYVEHLRAGSTAYSASERAAARERLLELGLTDEEIAILEHTLQPTAMVNIRAPMSGTVVSRAVYEGQYVQTNDRLFEIGDFSSMWFVFDAHEDDLAWIHVGQAVDVTTPSQPGRVFTAPVAFIDPNLNELTRTVRVRVILPNSDRALLHKQTALGLVHLAAPGVLLVPRSAVLQHTGAPLVFVEHGQRSYEPRGIRLGRIGDEFAEVLAGLKEDENVVTEAALLLDAQSQLARAAATEAPPAPVVAQNHGAAAEVAGGPSYEHLRGLALALADGAAALAADDFAGYQKMLPAIRAALDACLQDAPQGTLGRFKDSLPDRTDLTAARRDFEPFSTAAADLARAQLVTQRENLRVYQCPMTPVLGTGRWLARGTQIRNPFFGSAMLECGEEVK